MGLSPNPREHILCQSQRASRGRERISMKSTSATTPTFSVPKGPGTQPSEHGQAQERLATRQ